MLRSIPVTHLLAGIVTLGVARACYYYYYIEDPNNFAYRYCSVGCGESVKPDDPNYAQCCIPLSSGAPTPSTCTVLASSASASGTMCSWSAVPTTDMPPMSMSTNKINAMPTASCETKWVTETARPSACAASPPPASPTMPKVPANSFTMPMPTPTTSSMTSVYTSYSYSPPGTSKIEALPTLSPSSYVYTTSSDVSLSDLHTLSSPLPVPEAPAYTPTYPPVHVAPPLSSADASSYAPDIVIPSSSPLTPTLPDLPSDEPLPIPSTTFTPSTSFTSTYNTPSTSEIEARPICRCNTAPVGAGALPPDGWSKRNMPPNQEDGCECQEQSASSTWTSTTAIPSTSEIKALPTSASDPAPTLEPDPEPMPEPPCFCEDTAPVGAGALPPDGWSKRRRNYRRNQGGAECDCGVASSTSSATTTSSAMPSTSEVKALPTSTTAEPKPVPSLEPVAVPMPEVPCVCDTAPVGAGSLPKEPIARRNYDGGCVCEEPTPSTPEIKALPTASSEGTEVPPVPEPTASCSCDTAPVGAGALPKEPIAKRNDHGECVCDGNGSGPMPSTSEINAVPTASPTDISTSTEPTPSCSCNTAPVGAGALPKEPIAKRSGDGGCNCDEPLRSTSLINALPTASPTDATSAAPVPTAAQETQGNECSCNGEDQDTAPMGAGRAAPDGFTRRRKRSDGTCDCPPKGRDQCEGTAPMGAGSTPSEGFVKRDGTDGAACAAGAAGAGEGVLEAKPITKDQIFDGLRRRRLPPASLEPEQGPLAGAPATSKINALPTSAAPSPTPPPTSSSSPSQAPSKCVTTMTTTIFPACTPAPTAGGTSGNAAAPPDDWLDWDADADEDEEWDGEMDEEDYEGIEECDEGDEFIDDYGDGRPSGTDSGASNASSAASGQGAGASASANYNSAAAKPSSTAASPADDANLPFPARPGNGASTTTPASIQGETSKDTGGSAGDSEASDIDGDLGEIGFDAGGAAPLDFESLE